ncbi:MAG: DUF305 domain-containing protein [Rubrobacter sp.]
MKLYARLGLPGLLLAATLMVVSCGGGDMQGMEEQQGRPDSGRMKGMSQSKEDGSGGMNGTDQGEMNGMSSGMVMENGKYSDERFIDAMVPHHEGAVEMAEVALENAEHEQIEQLAEDIVSAQEAEIRELKSIKQEEFGTSKVPTNTSMRQMQGMGMMMNPQSLADEAPFDKAFIDNMIPHHRSAIEMAQVAATQTENPEIKDLATNIVEAQKREISQMELWRQRWYPQA